MKLSKLSWSDLGHIVCRPMGKEYIEIRQLLASLRDHKVWDALEHHIELTEKEYEVDDE